MSDKSVDRQASDLFNLGSNFKAQRSSSNVRQDIVAAQAANGDTHAEVERNARTEYQATYQYVGTDLASDFVAKIGQVVNSILVDEVVFRFQEKEAVQVEVQGHNHAQNAHAAAGSGEFDGFGLELATIIGSNVAGWDVPASLPFANSEADSDQIGLTLSYRAEHQDQEGHDGNHFVGKSYNGLLTVTCEHLGVPSLTIGSGWVTESAEAGDANQSFDQKTTTARKVLSRTTAQ